MSEAFYPYFSFLCGLAWGSFTNVLIARLPENLSILYPPSTCPKCWERIRWWDNIPVLGYLLLRGKCRSCGDGISPRYLIVEILMGVLFLASYYKTGWEPLLFLRDWPLMVILVAVTFIDLKHRIIPDSLSLGGLVLGLATTWAVPEIGIVNSFIGAALGFSIFFAFSWVYLKLTGRLGLGGGDIKLLAMLGAFLGPSGVMATVLLSSILGTLVGLAWVFISRKKEVLRVAIPYGPFLVIGGLFAYFVRDALWYLYTIRM